jgi:hypothetical protein
VEERLDVVYYNHGRKRLSRKVSNDPAEWTSLLPRRHHFHSHHHDSLTLVALLPPETCSQLSLCCYLRSLYLSLPWSVTLPIRVHTSDWFYSSLLNTHKEWPQTWQIVRCGIKSTAVQALHK